MSKRQILSSVPPLSFEALEAVQKFEDYAQHALLGCSGGFLFNDEKAIRILQTCIVDALDVQIEYFSSLAGYDPKWIQEIIEKTITSSIGLLPYNADADFIEKDLRRTVDLHLKRGESRSAPAKAQQTDRPGLRDAYQEQFEGVRILDVCWAAGQHYREWKRWLKGELKDGTTPDLAFRRVLTSGKRPEQLNRKPRPKSWQ
jgi:hypothetical protein